MPAKKSRRKSTDSSLIPTKSLYGKQKTMQWLLIYFVFGTIIYLLIYYFILGN